MDQKDAMVTSDPCCLRQDKGACPECCRLKKIPVAKSSQHAGEES